MSEAPNLHKMNPLAIAKALLGGRSKRGSKPLIALEASVMMSRFIERAGLTGQFIEFAGDWLQSPDKLDELDQSLIRALAEETSTEALKNLLQTPGGATS
jgi:hypothetical protein